jgi:hypothetical protein
MPTAQLKSFAKKSGKSIGKLERYWDEAKVSAKEKFGSKKKPGYWPYVVGIVERRAGLRKKLKECSFRDFIALDEEMGKPRKFKIEKGLTNKEALEACPWKKEYGDCRAFGYDPKTGECVWQ